MSKVIKVGYAGLQLYSCHMKSLHETVTPISVLLCTLPLYNTVHYNTVLDITQFKDDPKYV